MTKYLLAALAAMVLALGGLGLLYRAEVRKSAESEQRFTIAVQALSRVEEQRKQDARTLAARQAAIAAQRVLVAQAQEGLQKALQANSVWSDTEVPTDVQQALTRRSERSSNADN